MSAVLSRDPLPIYTTAPPADHHLVAFGSAVANALHVPLPQLGPEPLIEAWPSHEEVLFGAASIDDGDSIEERSRELYARLIAQVRKDGYPYFLRMWNHVGRINAHDGGRERYQLFCAGRHDAFVDAGYHHDVDLPAASAVGMREGGVVTYFLAAREPGVQVENPRQVAAYDYPPRYGPKSPSFSRATVWRDTVFVSGTSSVVGHESVHAGDVAAQLEETLRNIELVLGRAGARGGLDAVVAAKTYIRRASDYEAVARRLEGVFASNLYVEADICRADLLLEIEAVARRR
ncbi:MAG TPA: Rid family hydrolase [Thermoanaerobaculia bacterium]|jgi:chorismate lyase/3-hydroxybenzoate synthase